MTNEIVLLKFGSLALSLRSLLTLLNLILFACLSFVNARRSKLKKSKVVWVLCAGYALMFVLSRLMYLIAERNAVRNLLAGGEITFAGFLGFLAGVRLYCLSSKKAWKRLLKLFMPAFFPFAAISYILRDSVPGLPATFISFTYTDAYGMSRANVPLTQGITILALILLAFGLQSVLKPSKFKLSYLPMTISVLSLILPIELMRDSTQAKIFGCAFEAFLIWLCLICLSAVYLIGRLRKTELGFAQKLASFALAIILPILSVLSLPSASAPWCLVLTFPISCLNMSPLFPYIKRRGRMSARRRRSFS